MLDWRKPAQVLERKVRAFNPVPVAFTQARGTEANDRIRVWSAQVIAGNNNKTPGTIISISADGIRVSCAEDSLLLQQLQLPGKKVLAVEELLRGHSTLFTTGDSLELPA